MRTVSGAIDERTCHPASSNPVVHGQSPDSTRVAPGTETVTCGAPAGSSIYSSLASLRLCACPPTTLPAALKTRSRLSGDKASNFLRVSGLHTNIGFPVCLSLTAYLHCSGITRQRAEPQPYYGVGFSHLNCRISCVTTRWVYSRAACAVLCRGPATFKRATSCSWRKNANRMTARFGLISVASIK